MSGTTRGRRVYLPEGREFPGWTVESHLADGSVSSVYRARYTGLRVNEFPAKAALKITALLPAERQRLIEEYETARRFSGHPHVVQVYDVFETDTIEYGRCVVLVHELGEESLRDWLDESGPLTRLELQRLAHNVADGIAALHEAKIIHSDIKPANILSFPTGWKVADLGAAAVIHQTNTNATSADYYAGTLAYSTPEHARAIHEGRSIPPVHRDADTWAFGVVIHEAATGEHPFRSTSALIEGAPILHPSLPTDVADLVASCLSPSGVRPRSGRDLLELLDASAGQTPSQAAAPREGETPDKPAPQLDEAPQEAAPKVVTELDAEVAGSSPSDRGRRPVLVAVAAALAALVGLSLWAQTRPDDDQSAETIDTAVQPSDDTQPAEVTTTVPPTNATSSVVESNPTVRAALAGGVVTLNGAVPSTADERSLIDLMESVVGAGNVRSTVTVDSDAPQPDTLSLDVVDEIQFATGSSTISAEFLTTLNQIVSLMNFDPSLTVVVKGHTDATGDKVANLALSQRRAEAVVDYIASEGINRFRLEPLGRGSAEPIADESTADGRKQNRRIEFSLRGLSLSS